MFGGWDVNGAILNSIEKLGLADLANGEAVWRLIDPPSDKLSGRAFSVVATINSQEIVILGGQVKSGDFTS